MKYPAYIYVMVVGGTGKTYVGISANPKARFARHKSLLQAGKHPVEDMQADYNASTNKHLSYFVMEKVNTETERFKEHRWQVKLQSYDRSRGYNYKDPTARGETARAEKRAQCKVFLKERIQKAVYPHREPPIPLSEKRRAELWEEASKMTDDEIRALVG